MVGVSTPEPKESISVSVIVKLPAPAPNPIVRVLVPGKRLIMPLSLSITVPATRVNVSAVIWIKLSFVVARISGATPVVTNLPVLSASLSALMMIEPLFVEIIVLVSVIRSWADKEIVPVPPAVTGLTMVILPVPLPMPARISIEPANAVTPVTVTAPASLSVRLVIFTVVLLLLVI